MGTRDIVGIWMFSAVMLAGATALADWREVRVLATVAGVTGTATHAEGDRAARGLGAGAGVDLTYGLTDAVEVGVAARFTLLPGMNWADVSIMGPDGRTEYTGRLEGQARAAFAGPVARLNAWSDNRLAVFVAVAPGILRRSFGALTLRDPSGRVLLPYKDPTGATSPARVPADDHTGPGVAGAAGVDIRLGRSGALGFRIEGLSGLGGPRPIRTLAVAVAAGWQFYP